MLDVYVAGVGLTTFGKDERPIGAILSHACRMALADSAPYTSDLVPDCVVIGSMDPIGFARQTGLDSLVGIELELARDTEIHHVELGSATGAAAIELGTRLVSPERNVLVCFGEKMKGKLRNEDIPSQISTVIAIEERERGLGEMPSVAALASLEYMDVFKVSEQEFKDACYEMSVSSLWYGALNEFAYFREPITREQYDDPAVNRIIAAPLTKLDCSGSYNGAGAVFLTAEPTDIRLPAISSAFDNIRLTERNTLVSLEATVLAGRRAFSEARLNPCEIDICELHDAFKPVPWIACEDLGLCERGEGVTCVLKELNREGRRLRVNRSGGFLARTHPLGASGGAQLVELVWQLRGHGQYKRMFSEDQEKPDFGLWFNMSGFGNTCIVGIVEKTEPARRREGFREDLLPTSIPEKYLYLKSPRKDRIIAATRYESPDSERVDVAIIQTTEGDFRIGLTSDASRGGKKRYISWIKSDESWIKTDEELYFVREGYFKGKWAGLLRRLRGGSREADDRDRE